MIAFNVHKKTKRLWSIFVLLCLLIANLGSVQVVQAAPTGCSVIYTSSEWVIDTCTTDPNISTPMQVLVNGASKGNVAMMRVYHKSQNDPGTPQVMVIYASGYIRLKQNANPTPAIPFGTSFILGPAYGTNGSTYYNNPQLNRLDVDTTLQPKAPLRMRAAGTNHDFAVTYEMTLPPPEDSQTRLHVSQTYTAVNAVSIDPTRRAERQGFKLVQASSMYINEGGSCAGVYTDCHDSNGARFIGSDLVRHQVSFAGLTLPAFLFSSPTPLGSTWIDVLHTDNQSWQSATGAGTSGNTPNVRIALDNLPSSHTITPQGRISSTTDPNQDNVGIWLHDDGPASTSWLKNQSAQISYWLIAQDNPPDPWADQGLRTGSTFLDLEGTYTCFPVKDAAQSTTAAVSAINGYTNRAIQLNYNLGGNNNNWAQIRCNFNPPLNLSADDHLRFEWRGDPAAGNSIQVGLINPAAGGEYIFARGYHHTSQRGWWGQMVVPFSFLNGWTPGTQFDPSQVSAFFISVIKDGPDDNGGSGSLALDNLSANDLRWLAAPAVFDVVDTNAPVAQSAANWLASQQQSTGLVKSWQEETSCVSYTYDQALALIVFTSQGMWPQADALANGLAAVQNTDGSWFKSRNCIDRSPLDSNKWEGDIAWAVYALGRYLSMGGTALQAVTAQQKGADWLATRINPADGCLVIDHTEGTIDAWWAFQSAGSNYAYKAEQIKTCLLTYYWDNDMGRFKGGRNWWQPYLDNQTWGAAFLKAIGENDKAYRALSYAQETLRLPAQGGQLYGFDGQAGPWSVWNEGTAQYVAVSGYGSSDLLQELLAQQRWDGAMPSSPDEFSGGGVWTTPWHGVAPTAWLYNALCGEPFHLDRKERCSVPRLPTPWTGGISVSSDRNVVAVGRPHVSAEVASYGGFAQGSLTSYVPMLFKNAYGTYNSALYVQNVSGTQATVTARYYDSDGNLKCTKNDTIQPLSSKGYWLPTETCNSGSIPPGFVGGAVITSNQSIVAVGRPHVGGEVMTYDGFTSGSTTSYIPMLFKGAYGGSYNSAFYIQNVNNSIEANITIKYYDSNGLLKCTKADKIKPLASKGYWVPTAICDTGSLPAGWVGGVIVTSTQPIVGIGRPHIGTQVTTYNGFTGGGSSSYIPMLFKGAYGGSYNAAFYLQNTSGLQAHVTIKYYSDTGTLNCTKTDTIQPLASSGYWLPSTTCDTGSLPPAWVGGVVVTSDQPIVGVGRPHIDTQVTTYNGFTAGSANSFLPMLFKAAYGGSYNSAFYIQNTENNPASVTIAFYDTDGHLTCTRQDIIPALSTLGFWVPAGTCTP